jgi:hypothetical protein
MSGAPTSREPATRQAIAIVRRVIDRLVARCHGTAGPLQGPTSGGWRWSLPPRLGGVSGMGVERVIELGSLGPLVVHDHAGRVREDWLAELRAELTADLCPQSALDEIWRAHAPEGAAGGNGEDEGDGDSQQAAAVANDPGPRSPHAPSGAASVAAGAKPRQRRRKRAAGTDNAGREGRAAGGQTAGGDVPCVTLVRSLDPAAVNKHFTLQPDGSLAKRAVAHITTGRAKSRLVPDAASLLAALDLCASRQDCCLIASRFLDDDGSPFTLLSKRELKRRLGLGENESVPAGIVPIGRDVRGAARLKVSVTPSPWLLFDADDAPDIPDHLRNLDLRQRLALFDQTGIIPGVANAERVVMRSSSFRVRQANAPPRRMGHAWIRVSDAAKIPLLRVRVTIMSVVKDVAFRSPRHARQDDPKSGIKAGQAIAFGWRSVFDNSVWSPERLVFVAQPTLGPGVAKAGFLVDPPGLVIENEGSGALDLGWLAEPTTAELDAYRRITGHHMHVALSPGQLAVTERGQLAGDTPIEIDGRIRPLADLVAEADGRECSLRSETPFRASHSGAGFLRIRSDGSVSLYDHGTGITHRWFGPATEVLGTPGRGTVVALGEHRRRALAAMRLSGCGRVVLVPDLDRFVGIRLDEADGDRRVLLIAPPGLDEDPCLEMRRRLGAAGLDVVIWPPTWQPSTFEPEN